jgi:hypothetical protein
MLEKSYLTWETRWNLKEYNRLVMQRNSKDMNSTIDQTLRKMGIDEKTVICRGLMIRYLMDISQ